MALLCGCMPDASGYGYCGKCVQALRKKIWSKMSEDRKNYDRYFAPQQSAELDRLCDGDPEYGGGCSCHINPPCGYCVNKGEEYE